MRRGEQPGAWGGRTEEQGGGRTERQGTEPPRQHGEDVRSGPGESQAAQALDIHREKGLDRRLNMEIDLGSPKFIWAPVYSCTH